MKPQNAFEIFKLLEKSNCGNCGERTCLAFAGAVFKGQRQVGECPRLDPKIVARYAEGGPSPGVPEPEGAAHFCKLKNEVAGLDLAAAARRPLREKAEGRPAVFFRSGKQSPPSPAAAGRSWPRAGAQAPHGGQERSRWPWKAA